jgi:hypothetical protein
LAAQEGKYFTHVSHFPRICGNRSAELVAALHFRYEREVMPDENILDAKIVPTPYKARSPSVM